MLPTSLDLWVSDVSVVCVSEGCESEWSEVKWSEVKWSEWVSEWVSEGVSEWVCEWVSEWVSEWVTEWVSECVWVSEWLNEWVSDWMSDEEDHACHAKEAETQGRQRNPRVYIQPLGSAHCPTPATQKRRCTLCHACHAKEAETQGTPGRTSDPLAVHIVPRLPRKRGGDPRDARAYIRPLGSAHCPTPATQKRRRPKGRQGVHPTPWQCTLCHACHERRRPKGRQGVHPTPWQCTLCHACHAKEAETQGTPGRTSDPLEVHIVPRLPRKRGGDPRDARAYIRPLGSAHCPTPATQKRRRPKGCQGVHPTPWQCTLCHACHAKEAETQGTPGRTSEPLAVHIVPRLPRKRGGDPRDARAYIRALGSAHCATPATQKRRRPKGRQGVHRTPWQCTLCHNCHAKEACTLSEWVRVSESEWVWVSECEWVRVSEWEWVRVSESEWVSVSEWESEGGRAGEAADAELKTKTPHVNVGNNCGNVFFRYVSVWFGENFGSKSV